MSWNDEISRWRKDMHRQERARRIAFVVVIASTLALAAVGAVLTANGLFW